MTLSIQGGASAAGTSLTLPTHAIGDLIVIWAYRDGSTTAPTKPTASGTVPAWVTVATPTGGNANVAISAYFVATATNHTSGTWTNATGMAAQVIRGQANSPIGGNARASGTGASPATAPAVTQTATDGSSILLEFFGAQNITAWNGADPGYGRQIAAVSPTGICINTKNDTHTDGASTQGFVASSSGGYWGEQIEILSATSASTAITRRQAAGSGHGITGGFGPQTVTLPNAVQAGSLLVCLWIGNSNTGSATMADNVNGAWTALAQQTPFAGSGRRMNWFYKLNSAPAAAGALTVTLTPVANAGNSEWLQVAEYTGIGAYDSAVSAYATWASTTALAQLSGTPSKIGDLILFGFTSDSETVQNMTAVSPMTAAVLDSASKSGGQAAGAYPLGFVELLGAGAGPVRAAMNLSSGGDDGGQWVIGFNAADNSQFLPFVTHRGHVI